MSHVTLTEIARIAAAGGSRAHVAARVAETIRRAGGYRWVGVYDVDERDAAIIAWSGKGPPAYPRFPRTKGLTGAAVATGATVIVNDVTNDRRYLDAFGDTRAEIIVPIRHGNGEVVGTIDVESEVANAFGARDQRLLEACAEAARPLWSQRG